MLWCGKFGRTVFEKGDVNNPARHGRDHFGACSSLWVAGGGFRGGTVQGETDGAGKVVPDTFGSLI